MRRALSLLLATLAVGASLAAAPVVDEHCATVPEASERACASIGAAGGLAAGLCEQVPHAPRDVCGRARGQTVDPAWVDAYVDSDLARLHAAQRALARDVPLGFAQVLATHNSYNSSAYLPAVSNQDPNHWYSLTDQLRMETRALELDVHTWIGADDDGRLPVLCHATGPHLGCSADRPLTDGLAEIRVWLDANPDEVLLLDLENHLDGLAGHDEAAAVLTEHLGDVLYAPPSDAPCAPMPLDRSLADVRATGAQVLVVSSCGVGDAWGSLVHHYGDWHQGRLASFDDACGPDYDRATYDGSWTRYWEDTTWLSAMAGGVGPRLDTDVLVDAMACGLSMASIDRLHPQDPRLEVLLWSWSLDARPWEATPSDVAVLGPDERLHVVSAAAAAELPVLCRTATAPAAFTVALDGACADGAPGTPRTAREQWLAVQAMRDAGAVSSGARTAWRGGA